MYCKSCGASLFDNEKFCPSCGAENTQATAPPEEQSQEPQQGSAYPQQGFQPPHQASYGGYKAPVNARNLALAIVLTVVTFGIYGIIWQISLVDDLNKAARTESDTSGVMVFLFTILTCGIYWLIWNYRAGEKVNKIKQYNGEPYDSSLSILYLLLCIFGLEIVSICLIQNEVNKVAAIQWK